MSADNTENEHLLQNKWVCWFRPPTHHTATQPKADQWEESQKKYFDATTVEQFWRGFHNLPRITPGHPINCDYSLFKEGIKPMWEDPLNENGGRWTYTVERRHAANPNASMPQIIEQIWLDVMLCLIGEGFDPVGDKVAGGVVGIRLAKGGNTAKSQTDNMTAKVHIWTLDAKDNEANTLIGETLKRILNLPSNQLVYSPHKPSGGGGGGGRRGNMHSGDLLRV